MEITLVYIILKGDLAVRIKDECLICLVAFSPPKREKERERDQKVR